MENKLMKNLDITNQRNNLQCDGQENSPDSELDEEENILKNGT
jgi:hypothetical protein